MYLLKINVKRNQYYTFRLDSLISKKGNLSPKKNC